MYTRNLLTFLKKKLQTDTVPSIKRIIVFSTSYVTLAGVPLLRKMTDRSRDRPFLLNCNNSTNYKIPMKTCKEKNRNKRLLLLSFNASARAAAAIPANCSSAVPCILMSVFCQVCLARCCLRTNSTFLNLKKCPLLLVLDIAGHILVFNRGSLHTWRVISSSFVLCYLSNII